MKVAQYPELHERRVVITGAASGIGSAVLERFFRAGARVAALDRGGADLAKVAQRYPGVLPLQADVSCESEVQAAFRRVDEAWGGPDILIANAGLVSVIVLKKLPWTSGTRCWE